MLEFMDYVQQAFYNASHWNLENSYSQLTATARGKQTIPRPLESSNIYKNSSSLIPRVVCD